MSTFGQFNDPVTGKVKATAYNLIGLSGGHLPDETDVFVKAYMKLAIDDFRMTSVLSGEEINFHQAEDSLFTSAVYLSNKSIPYNPEPLFVTTFDFDPRGDQPDSIITVDLSDEFALQYYQRLYRAGTDTTGEALDSLRGNYYFREPLVMVPGENNQGLYNIDLSSEYTGIYFEMEDANGDTTYTYQYKFRQHFSNIERDKSASELSDLTQDYAVSNNSGTYSYTDVIAGVYTKVSLKPILDFIQDKGQVTVNSSLLELHATAPNPNHTDNIQNFYSFFVLDNGKINGPGGFAPNAGIYAVLRDDSYYSGQANLLSLAVNDENIYKSNMALFTQLLFDNFNDGKDFLADEFVLVSPLSSTLNQTALINSEVKLTLYYTSLTE